MEKEIINKRLSELKTSEEGVITKVFGHGSFRNRITEMGFVRGKTVRVIKNAPLSDPIEYEIMGYRIALRKSEAELIEISLPSGGTAGSGLPSGGTFRDESVNRFQHVTGRTINVALVGNPNSGKTSLFNVASGSHERVGNYSGVTVDAKQAVFRQDGYTFNLFDLPGTYSITEYTPEELYVRRHILDAMPDVVINVLDASNLERNLFLTTQLIDMDLKVVIALNMYDELEKSGLKLDYRNLGRMIGIPIVPTVASRGEGIRELFKTVIDVFEDNEPIVRHIHINYGKDIEHSIRLLQDEIWKNTDLVARYSSRYLAIKLLCNDKNGYEVVEPAANFAEISAVAEHERQKLERQYKDCVETIITDAKFGFIAGALEETCQGINLRKNRPDDRVDRIMTHKVWGLPIFLLIMWIMFQTTFSLGGVPAGWLETGVEWLGDFIGGIMREGPLRELIVNGIISGVGGVIVFLPNILILFFFISLMEDTGYMARAAFIMDKVMHRIGLHGKSFIPLIMGFGCNVPAIMATRTIESRSSRLITALITPFMSCSARLPIYLLLAGTFFPSHAGLVLFGLYVLGILVAVMTARLMRRSFFKVDETPFVMELPPYRMPTWKATMSHMWDKCAQYLRKMGGLILAASVIVWFLSYYPRPEAGQSYEQHYENSYLGRVGKACEPVFEPLGLNWKASVAVLSGVAAKEIVVSTMGVLYSESADAPAEADAPEKLRTERIGGADGPTGIRVAENASAEAADDGTGASADEEEAIDNLPQRLLASGDFTAASAAGFLVFILIYFPCLATIAAIAAESGWKWAAGSVVYSTALAWIMSYLTYRIVQFFV